MASRAFTRREFAASLAALTATGCAHRLPSTPAQAPPTLPAETLKGAAARHGLLAGCAVSVHNLRNTPAYASLIAEQASIVVAESEMKFGPLRPTPTTFFFDDADFLAAFAAQHGMQLRGHNFVWHRQLPQWFDSYVTPANAQDVLVNHINTVAGHFRGRIHSWDVVNEAIHLDDHLPGGLRNSPWQKVLPGYIDIAFRTARSADPKALLCYNDYGIEGEDAGSEAKRKAVLDLLRGMQQRGVPLDAVGVQSHIAAGGSYGPGLMAFFNQLDRMKLKILLTEMDVNDRDLPADPLTARDQAVAATYGSYLRTTLQDPNVLAVLTWGITDRFTWLNGEDNRHDGKPNRCLPFDADFRPKPAFFAERNALAKAPQRA